MQKERQNYNVLYIYFFYFTIYDHHAFVIFFPEYTSKVREIRQTSSCGVAMSIFDVRLIQIK